MLGRAFAARFQHRLCHCGSKTTWASWCARTIGGLSNLFIETGIEIRTSFHRHYHRTVKEAVLKSGAMIGYSIRQEHPACLPTSGRTWRVEPPPSAKFHTRTDSPSLFLRDSYFLSTYRPTHINRSRFTAHCFSVNAFMTSRATAGMMSRSLAKSVVKVTRTRRRPSASSM